MPKGETFEASGVNCQRASLECWIGRGWKLKMPVRTLNIWWVQSGPLSSRACELAFCSCEHWPNPGQLVLYGGSPRVETRPDIFVPENTAGVCRCVGPHIVLSSQLVLNGPPLMMPWLLLCAFPVTSHQVFLLLLFCCCLYEKSFSGTKWCSQVQ